MTRVMSVVCWHMRVAVAASLEPSSKRKTLVSEKRSNGEPRSSTLLVAARAASMFPRWWILLLVANSRTVDATSSEEVRESCQKRDAVRFNGSYFVAHNSCDDGSRFDRRPCQQCDLIVHQSACSVDDEAWNGLWCDNSIECLSFQCTRHHYYELRQFAEQCDRGEPDAPCPEVSHRASCELTLSALGPSARCIPSTVSVLTAKKFLRKSDRIPITDIQLAFLENSSNVDSSENGSGVYVRPHLSSQYLYDPWLLHVRTFLRTCAVEMLRDSRFVLLYLAAANSAVEFGHNGEEDHDRSSYSDIFMCTVKSPPEFATHMRLPIMLVGISLSLVGLALTAIVSVLLVEHRNVPGFNLLSLVASLFVAYLSVPIAIFHKKSPTDVCLVAGMTHIFTILASVFWMNVVAFDIWQSLSTVQHLDQYRTSEHYRRLIHYSIYAWGVPGLLLGCGALLDRLPGLSRDFRPGFTTGCWFSQESTTATILLYNGPIGLVMIANTVFFLLTARIVFQAQRQRVTTMRVADAHKYHFSLYVKLFLVMGLTWVMESLTGAIHSEYYELISDFVNTLQGFFIFFIFGCKMRVYRRLRRGCCGKTRGRHNLGATLASTYPNSSTYRSERDASIKISNPSSNTLMPPSQLNDTTI